MNIMLDYAYNLRHPQIHQQDHIIVQLNKNDNKETFLNLMIASVINEMEQLNWVNRWSDYFNFLLKSEISRMHIHTKSELLVAPNIQNYWSLLNYLLLRKSK